VSERIELVTDFATLRVALPVVVRGCGVCGGEHAGSLVEKTSRRVPYYAGIADWTACWVVVPTPQCVRDASADFGDGRILEWVVTPMSVAAGRVFVVVEGDEQAAATTAKRTKADAR
jgi:hypothetical protein